MPLLLQILIMGSYREEVLGCYGKLIKLKLFKNLLFYMVIIFFFFGPLALFFSESRLKLQIQNQNTSIVKCLTGLLNITSQSYLV